MGYIANFIVYTLAMVGVIVVALLVFKNATAVSGGKTSKYLKIIDSISLGQRKNLFIVSTVIKPAAGSFKETLESLPKQNYADKSNIGIKSSLLNEKTNSSVMRNLAERIRK